MAADQAGQYVLIVTSENKVDRRSVKTGAKFGDLIVITEGLTAEETVIIDGLQRARPGAEVNPEKIELSDDITDHEPTKSSG